MRDSPSWTLHGCTSVNQALKKAAPYSKASFLYFYTIWSHNDCSKFPWDEDGLWASGHPRSLSPQPTPETPSVIMMGCWGPAISPWERKDEEEDDAEGWGPKPQFFVRWQKLANPTIVISHSRSLSDYTDHYTALVECVGVCFKGGGWLEWV